MSVTAKMKVQSKMTQGEGDNRQANVTFVADYENGRNKEWALYTPGASLIMGLRGSVADLFEVNQAYTLTLERDRDGDTGTKAVDDSQANAGDEPASGGYVTEVAAGTQPVGGPVEFGADGQLVDQADAPTGDAAVATGEWTKPTGSEPVTSDPGEQPAGDAEVSTGGDDGDENDGDENDGDTNSR